MIHFSIDQNLSYFIPFFADHANEIQFEVFLLFSLCLNKAYGEALFPTEMGLQ